MVCCSYIGATADAFCTDSVTENHYFSLSCLLYPHVRATPDYRMIAGYDHGWPQNLYLNPDSPLIPHLRFPEGFDIAATPLVTYLRIDLLYTTRELDALYHARHPYSKYRGPDESVFSDEATWTESPSEYVRLFTAPLPQANYATMVVSTGGHWTTTLLAGLRDAQLFNEGVYNVVAFFAEAMDAWARDVQRLLGEAEREGRWRGGVRGREGRAPRQVVVRPYLPGHEDCHSYRAPVGEYTKGPAGLYNWNQIVDYNRAFEVRPVFPPLRARSLVLLRSEADCDFLSLVRTHADDPRVAPVPRHPLPPDRPPRAAPPRLALAVRLLAPHGWRGRARGLDALHLALCHPRAPRAHTVTPGGVVR